MKIPSLFFRITVEIGGIKVTTGLWKGCATESGQTECATLSCPSAVLSDAVCGKILATRALITLACIASAISVVLLLLTTKLSGGQNMMLLLIPKIVAAVTFMIGIIGVALGIYTFKEDTNSLVKLGAAAILGIIALIVNLVGVVVAALVR